MPLSGVDFIAGLAYFAATVGLVLAAAIVMGRSWQRNLQGASKAVAIAVLTTAGLLLAHLAPGMLGVLSRGSVLMSAALIAGMVLVASRSAVPGASSARTAAREAEASSRLESWLCFGAVAVVAAFVLGTIVDRGASAPANLDATGFHLPGIAVWIQESSIWGIHQFLPGIPTGEYPQNGDLLMLSSVLPWDNEAFVRLVNYPFLAVLALSVYATSRELGSPRPGAAVAAALLLAVPAINEPATLKLMTDAPSLALLAAGVLFLVRHVRSEAGSDLLLAGVALGLSLGTKWYAVAAVITVLGVWVLGRLLQSRRFAALRPAIPLAIAVAAAGGFWFLRNLVGTGNPFYPVRFEPFGVPLLSAPPLDVDRFGYTIAHYLGSPGILVDYVAPALADEWALPALLLLLAVPATLVLARRGNAAPKPAQPLVLGLATASILLLIVYSITPGTAYGPEGEPILTAANTRYGTPALVLAAPLFGWVLGRLGRLRSSAAVVACVGVIHGVALSREGLSVPAFLLGAVLVLLVVGGWAAWRGGASAFPRAGRLAAAAMVALLVAGAGYLGQDRYNDGRFAADDPTFVPFLRSGASDLTVGVAGYWSADGPSPMYPAFGPRLDNDVEYVGDLIDGNLRALDNRRDFTRRLAERGYDYVVIGLEIPPGTDEDPFRWARESGFVEVVRSERLALLARPGIATPAGSVG